MLLQLSRAHRRRQQTHTHSHTHTDTDTQSRFIFYTHIHVFCCYHGIYCLFYWFVFSTFVAKNANLKRGNKTKRAKRQSRQSNLIQYLVSSTWLFTQDQKGAERTTQIQWPVKDSKGVRIIWKKRTLEIGFCFGKS